MLFFLLENGYFLQHYLCFEWDCCCKRQILQILTLDTSCRERVTNILLWAHHNEVRMLVSHLSIAFFFLPLLTLFEQCMWTTKITDVSFHLCKRRFIGWRPNLKLTQVFIKVLLSKRLYFKLSLSGAYFSSDMFLLSDNRNVCEQERFIINNTIHHLPYLDLIGFVELCI